MPFIAIALVVALALGGGVTVAAENAKPDDTLYTYKVHVNDSVRAGAQATVHGLEHLRTSIESTFTGNVDSDSDVEESDSADTAVESSTHSGLRVRSDAEVKAETSDDQSINADGSLKAHIEF